MTQPPGGGAFLTELWSQQSIWSRTADAMKRRIERARLTALGVVVTMAVLGTLAGTIADSHPTLGRVLASTAAFGAVVLTRLRPGWSGRSLESWTRARSVSEALKMEVYLFLAQVGDYADTARRLESLRTNTDDIQARADDVADQLEGITPQQRGLPDVSDTITYFEVRVDGQINTYYQPRAHELRRRLRRFGQIETALVLLGGALGVLAAVVGTGTVAPWIPVTTTVGTAIAVHVAATRYQFQRLEFLRTAGKLRRLRREAMAPGMTEERRGELVLEAERVISIENEGWMAALAEDPEDQKAATETT
jgi:hypothetical protein